jgi:hypothetical protein
MRSFNLDARPKNLGQLQFEARVLVAELLIQHINWNAYSSHIVCNRATREISSLIRERKGENAIQIELKPDGIMRFDAVAAVIVRAVGLVPDSSLVDLYSPSKIFNFSVHSEAFEAEIECLVAMPKSQFPGASFIVKSIREKLLFS